MGLWVFESCRAEWAARGVGVEYDELLGRVGELKEHQGFIFPDDPRLFNPPSMLEAVAAQLAETGQRVAIEDAPAADEGDTRLARLALRVGAAHD